MKKKYGMAFGLAIIVIVIALIVIFGTSAKGEAYLNGTIVEVGKDYLLVKPNEDDKLYPISQIYVATEDLEKVGGKLISQAQIGDTVRVAYEKGVTEDQIPHLENPRAIVVYE